MRHVKFSPEEMAYDLPEDTADWTPVGRGPDAIFDKPAKPVVSLDADVAKVFGDEKQVNNALRKLIEAMPDTEVVKRRKSA